ncbi:PAS domain S-box protein [Chloroflexota bacterium]
MKNDGNRKQTQLRQEVEALSKRVAEFEKSEAALKQAHERMQQSEQKYHSLVDRSNDGIILIQNGFIKFANPKTIKIIGVSMDDALGKPFIDFLSSESSAAVVDLYQKRMSGERMPDRYEIEFVRRDGRRMTLEVSGSIVEYEGKPADMAVIRDVTKDRRTQAKILESERRYRLLADNTTDLIWTVSADSPDRLTYISPSVTAMLGYSPEEAIDKKMEDVFTTRSSENAMKAFVEEMAVEEKGEQRLSSSRTLELELVRKGGSIVTVEANHSFIRGSDGRPIEILAVARDMTERKRFEKTVLHAAEEWRSTFDSIPDFVSIHSIDHRLTRLNKAFAETFKSTPKDLIGKTCYELVHGTKEPPPNCPHEQTLKTGKPALAEFFEPSLGIHLQVTTSPILDQNGELAGSVHITRDVTERKHMEEQLIMTDRLASIGELASGIAHELNNPLTSVIGFSQLMMEGNTPDEIKEDLGIVCSEAQRASNIVKNLLTFARKHTPVKQLSRLNAIIEDVLRLRAYEQRVNNIEVEKQLATDLGEIIVDYFQLQQVFLNIIVNAENAMLEAHGKGKLVITTERVNHVVRASFADNGPGITKENLSRIFAPFFTTKEVGKGTGLGLSICHGIVSAHGGQIYAESEPGKGSTFVVEVPIDSR